MEMRRAVASLLPLALLFIAIIAPSLGQTVRPLGATRVRAVEGAPLRLQCVLRPEQRVQWRRDGAAPPPDLRAAEAAAPGGVAASLEAARAAPRHAGRYTCADDAPALLLEVEPRAADAEEVGVVGSTDEVVYEVRGNLSLKCPLTSAANLPYLWYKNDTEVDKVPELKERYTISEGGALWRINGRAIEDDVGNYSCSVGAESVKWEVRGRTHAKLPANTNVVEGQRLKLTCRLIGKPYPRVSWLFSNSSEVNGTDVATLEGVSLRASEQGAEDAELVVEGATRAHAGVFTCVPAGGVPAATTTRVKDMYAALWPFLGICAEVIILCAIILIYERRRSKPEAEDSDTDNHDQEEKIEEEKVISIPIRPKKPSSPMGDHNVSSNVTTTVEESSRDEPPARKSRKRFVEALGAERDRQPGPDHP